MNVDSHVRTLSEVFSARYEVDFYQREYVWQRKNVDDLISDLSGEFLRNWDADDSCERVAEYSPYFMGEIVVSEVNGHLKLIDGQQRLTTLTLLLIFLFREFGSIPNFPRSDVERLIYSNSYGTHKFVLDDADRNDCMTALLQQGDYAAQDREPPSVQAMVDRFNDIGDCWNPKIDVFNVAHFTYWLMNRVCFAKVWTDSDDFAYVIFETMNDRGLSLTQVEMLRGYLLSKVDGQARDGAMTIFDGIVRRLVGIKLTSKSKAEFEFFKVFLRGHYAQDLSQGNRFSDFTQIGKDFHRWVRNSENALGLTSSHGAYEFIKHLDYFSRAYEKIHLLMQSRDARDFLHLVVNVDFGFTLQPALILSSVAYQDSDEEVRQKVLVVSRFLSKLLAWRVWNQKVISQSSLEATIYDLCKRIRGKSSHEISDVLEASPIDGMNAINPLPSLNPQNRNRFKVLIALITEIVARESGQSDYLLNRRDEKIEVEHIWSDHFEEHLGEFANEQEFASSRDSIGDLLVLPKSFNASYGDKPYSEKVELYLQQNVLAQSLNRAKYSNNPGFLRLLERSGLLFKPYAKFTKTAIAERTELYRAILEWHFS